MSLFSLPDDILRVILQYTSFVEYARLDIACCGGFARKQLMNVFQGLMCSKVICIDSDYHTVEPMQCWLMKRKIISTHFALSSVFPALAQLHFHLHGPKIESLSISLHTPADLECIKSFAPYVKKTLRKLTCVSKHEYMYPTVVEDIKKHFHQSPLHSLCVFFCQATFPLDDILTTWPMVENVRVRRLEANIDRMSEIDCSNLKHLVFDICAIPPSISSVLSLQYCNNLITADVDFHQTPKAVISRIIPYWEKLEKLFICLSSDQENCLWDVFRHCKKLKALNFFRVDEYDNIEDEEDDIPYPKCLLHIPLLSCKSYVKSMSGNFANMFLLCASSHLTTLELTKPNPVLIGVVAVECKSVTHLTLGNSYVTEFDWEWSDAFIKLGKHAKQLKHLKVELEWYGVDVFNLFLANGHEEIRSIEIYCSSDVNDTKVDNNSMEEEEEVEDVNNTAVPAPVDDIDINNGADGASDSTSQSSSSTSDDSDQNSDASESDSTVTSWYYEEMFKRDEVDETLPVSIIPNLTSVNLTHCYLTPRSYQILGQCKQLTVVSTQEVIINLQLLWESCPQLQELSVHGIEVLRYSHSNLQKLTLTSWNDCILALTPFPGYSGVSSFPSLHTLHLKSHFHYYLWCVFRDHCLSAVRCIILEDISFHHEVIRNDIVSHPAFRHVTSVILPVRYRYNEGNHFKDLPLLSQGRVCCYYK